MNSYLALAAETPAAAPGVLGSTGSSLQPEWRRFYRGLLETRGDKAAALATAQRTMITALRERRITAPSGSVLQEDPLLWAPFVVVGEPH